MPVYFVQQGDNGPIKIGVTNNVNKRLTALQGGSPVPLKLLVTFDGDQAFEAFLHRKFAHLRVHNEWFKPARELLDFIQNPDLDGIPSEGDRLNLFINLDAYLSQLKAVESTKPKGERRHIPSLSELAESIGMHQTSLSRLANNKVEQLNLETGDKIITEMRRRGFQMTVEDLIAYIPSNEVN
jgi:DNA-binding Xre family transcriptional regulator